MYWSTMTKDGRVTIPARLRRELGLERNSILEVIARPDGSIVLRPQTDGYSQPTAHWKPDKRRG